MDTGLQTLVAIARFHQLPAEPEQLKHEFSQGGQHFTDTQLLQAAKSLTLKAKLLKPAISDLKNDILPAIAKASDGSYFIVARVAAAQPGTETKEAQSLTLLIHDLRESAPSTVTEEELIRLWSGEIILIARRVGLAESLQQKFDISWFIPSLIKYRKLFFEVIVAIVFYSTVCASHAAIFPSGDGQSISTSWLYHT